MNSKNIIKMVFRSSVVIAALCGLYFFNQGQPTVPVNDKEALILQGLMQTIEYVHFAPKKVNDEMSKTVFKTYLDRLDGYKRYLTQKDIDQLKKQEYLVDDQINARTFEFFNASLPLLESGLKKAESYFIEAIDSPLNFTKGETYETDPDKLNYAKNDSDLKERW